MSCDLISALKRRELTVTLRKGNRASALTKRRRADGPTPNAAGSAAGTDEKHSTPAADGAPFVPMDQHQFAKHKSILLQQMNNAKTALQSSNASVRVAALQALKKQLELSFTAPNVASGNNSDNYSVIDAACQAGVVQQLATMIGGAATAMTSATAGGGGGGDAQSQTLEALSCLLTIAATDNIAHTTTIMQSGVTVSLTHLLASSSAAIQDSVAWCLANLASEDADFRHTIIKNGAAVPLVKLMAATGTALAKTNAANANAQASGGGGGGSVGSGGSSSMILMNSPEKKMSAPSAAASSSAVSPTLSLARTVVWCISNLLRRGGPGSTGRDPIALQELMKAGLGSALSIHMQNAIANGGSGSDEALTGDLCWIVCWIAQYGDNWIELCT